MFDTDDLCPVCEEPTVVVLASDGLEADTLREVVIDPEPVPDGNLVWVAQQGGIVTMRYLRRQDGEPPPGRSRYQRHACAHSPRQVRGKSRREAS